MDDMSRAGNIQTQFLPVGFKPQLSSQELRWLEDAFHLNAPIDTLCGDVGHRRPCRKITPHVGCRELTNGEIVHIGRNLYVTSPVLTALLISASTSMKGFFTRELPMSSSMAASALTALYMSELAGSYRIDPTADDGWREAVPVLNFRDFGKVMDNMPAFRGKAVARRAMGLAVSGAASPMESTLAILICAPKSAGGMGLSRRPEMNPNIVVREKGRTRRRFA